MKEITCKQCGALVDINDAVSVENEHLCMDCYAHDYFTCEHCGQIHLLSECKVVNSGTAGEIFVCSDCIDFYRRCDSCLNYFSNEYIWAEDGGSCICEHCSDQHRLCDSCGDIISVDYARYEDGCYYCDACYHEREIDESYVNEYHYKPEPVFLGDGDLYMGLELEVDNGKNMGVVTGGIYNLTDQVYLKHDSSLTDMGFEIVSHPATLEYHLNHLGWNKIIELCLDNGYRSHETSTCGLHIHVNRTFFGETEVEQDLNIAKLIILINKWWDRYIVPFSRRNLSQLDRWAAKPEIELSEYDSETEIIDIVKRSKNTGSYQGINLMNENTVELRMFKGTLKISTLFATIQFVDTVCRYAKKTGLAEICTANWKKLFTSGSFDELSTYLKNKELI